jgi:drug/metabolite transporter (DMT)-like permease
VAWISSSRIGIWAAFAAIYLLWGSTYVAVAVALRSMPPFLLMGTRSIAGGLILLACVKFAGRPIGTPRTWAFATGCGMLFFVGCHGVLAHVQQHVPSGLAAVMLATTPFWIVIAKVLLPGHRRALKNLLILTPGVAGVGLIAWQQVGSSSSGPDIADIILLLSASASWAVGTILSEVYTGSSSRIALAGMELVAGGLVLVGMSGAFGEFRSLDPGAISLASSAAWSYLVVAGTVLGFAAYIWLLKQISPTLVSTYTFVNPVIAVLLGWIVLGERPTVWVVVSATLVVTSVVGHLLVEAPSHSVRRDKVAVSSSPAGMITSALPAFGKESARLVSRRTRTGSPLFVTTQATARRRLSDEKIAGGGSESKPFDLADAGD